MTSPPSDGSDGFSLWDKINALDQLDEIPEIPCKHPAELLVKSESFWICGDCGIEIPQETKHAPDPSRCSIHRVRDKNIYDDLNNLPISNHIKDLANTIYSQVCRDNIHRGKYRKAIIFASVFNAYKIDQNPQDGIELMQMFHIDKKDAHKGLKFVKKNIPADSPIRFMHITPRHFIGMFMNRLNCTQLQLTEVLEFYEKIVSKSTFLNQCRPQSTAAGIIYFYSILKGHQFLIKEFTKKVQLSELTINKITKEIIHVIENSKED